MATAIKKDIHMVDTDGDVWIGVFEEVKITKMLVAETILCFVF